MKAVWLEGHPDEGSIHAWLDGEIDAADAMRIEEHAASCTACASAVSEARGLIAGASRVVRQLDATPAPLIRPAAPAVAAGSDSSAWRFLRVTPARASIAAMLLVAAGITLTRRQGAFDAIEPSSKEMSQSVTASAPAAAQDNLLDSAIKRRIAIEQPPRSVKAAPGPAVPTPAPAPVIPAEVAQGTDASARVATGRASLRAQADTLGAPPDRARVGLPAAPPAASPGLSRDMVAARAAEQASPLAAKSAALETAPSVANRCLRLESSAAGAKFGPEALPVVLVFDATGRNARVFSAAGSATETRASLVRTGADSLVLQLRRVGYFGQLAVSAADDTRAGFLRSAPQQTSAPEVVVTTTDESRARARAERRDAAPVSAAASASVGPAVPVTARTVSCPTG